MSETMTGWLHSVRRERTEPVDHRRLIKWLRRLTVVLSLVTLAIAGVMLMLGMAEPLICAVTGCLLSLLLLPTVLLWSAEIHTWYWIVLVLYGDADEYFLPPLPDRYEGEPSH